MEQTSTSSNTPTMQSDTSFSNPPNNKVIPQISSFIGQEILNQNPLISQLIARNASLQNLPSLSNLNSNSRTVNQLNSSSSLGGNNINGSNSNISNNKITSATNKNTSNKPDSPSTSNTVANTVVPASNNNANNDSQSPTNSNIANSLLNQLGFNNNNNALNFLNPANQSLLQLQQHLQQLQNQSFNLGSNSNGASSSSNLLGLPFQQLSQQQTNQQQQQLLFHLNMLDGANLSNLLQQQQQLQMDQINGAALNNLLAVQLQTFPNSMNICSKHSFKSDSNLKFICKSHNCSQQWQLLCQNCKSEHTPNHDIIDARLFMTQIKGNITESITTTAQQFNTIEALFNSNIQGIEGMQEHINNLLESLRSLQRAYFMMKLTSNNDISYLHNAVKEIEEPNTSINEKQLNEKIHTISKLSQNVRQVKMESFQQLISINQLANKVILDTKNQVISTQTLASNLQESFSQRMVGSEMKELEKKHQEEKTLEHFSKLFHLIKGHAKKRDVINFLTWEQQSKELKYSKDIKDKHGEHFYVSFSLKLKNIENMENKDIDENFISKIVKVVEEKAPEIQNKKNAERKKIDPNGKKRKYCRFNPRIEIDVSLNSSAYKNIKIE